MPSPPHREGADISSSVQATAATEVVRVAIVGAGFSGLGMGVQLKRHGEHSFVILERASDVGGTWRDNTYPGAACDVPSHLYSFSFRTKPDWSRVYAEQWEILGYLRDMAAEEGLREHIRAGADVLEAAWDDEARRWRIATTAGIIHAQILITATGHLSDPKLPSINGLATFRGDMFHSARWNHDVKLDGKRVGVIGSGASAIQVVPSIAPVVDHLTVFQRSAPYVIPRMDRAYSTAEKRMFRRVPEVVRELRNELYWASEGRFPQRRKVAQFVEKIEQLALGHLENQVPDPALRAKLTPDYTIGCKRILISNVYFPTFLRPNVSLETTGVEEVLEDGVLLRDGTRHELDALVLCTGFEASDLPISHRIRGRGGALLADTWVNGEQAYACSTVNGYPNLFIMNGPNSGLGAGSILFIVECQVSYILGALAFMAAEGIETLEISRQAEEAFVVELHRRAQGTVWLEGGCASWYVDPRNGRLTTIWPDFMFRYKDQNGVFDPAGYQVQRDREFAR